MSIFRTKSLDDMVAASPMRTEYGLENPLVDLLKALAQRPRLARVYIGKDDLKLELKGQTRSPAST